MSQHSCPPPSRSAPGRDPRRALPEMRSRDSGKRLQAQTGLLFTQQPGRCHNSSGCFPTSEPGGAGGGGVGRLCLTSPQPCFGVVLGFFFPPFLLFPPWTRSLGSPSAGCCGSQAQNTREGAGFGFFFLRKHLSLLPHPPVPGLCGRSRDRSTSAEPGRTRTAPTRTNKWEVVCCQFPFPTRPGAKPGRKRSVTTTLTGQRPRPSRPRTPPGEGGSPPPRHSTALAQGMPLPSSGTARDGSTNGPGHNPVGNNRHSSGCPVPAGSLRCDPERRWESPGIRARPELRVAPM